MQNTSVDCTQDPGDGWVDDIPVICSDSKMYVLSRWCQPVERHTV